MRLLAEIVDRSGEVRIAARGEQCGVELEVCAEDGFRVVRFDRCIMTLLRAGDIRELRAA
jgi:hypothetical protein